MKTSFVVVLGMLFLTTDAALASNDKPAQRGVTDFEEVPDAVVATGRELPIKSSKTELDGDDMAANELLKIANSEEESLRVAAVQVLGEMGTPRAKACLGIVLYGNSMGTVRAAAADELGNIGDGEAVYTLAIALDTERDSEVRSVINANIERALPADSTSRVASAETSSRTK